MADDKNRTENRNVRKHGILLTIFMALSLFGAFSSLFSLNPDVLIATYGEIAWWTYPYVISGILFAVLIFIGIWKWKRWVIYVYLISAIGGIIAQILIVTNYNTPVGFAALIPAIAFSIFWFWAIYRKKENFE